MHRKTAQTKARGDYFPINTGVEAIFALIAEQGAKRHGVSVALVALKLYSLVSSKKSGCKRSAKGGEVREIRAAYIGCLAALDKRKAGCAAVCLRTNDLIGQN